MNLMQRVLVLGIFIPLLHSPTWGQQSVTIATSDPAFLVRIERLQDDQDVCVLVNQAGQYRLERMFVAKTQVFAGELSQQELERLKQTLDSDDLRAINELQIQSSLIVNSTDTLSLSISRPSGAQNLIFPAAQSRKPFQRQIEPLLKFLGSVQKEKHTRLDDSAANRCMPASKPTLTPAERDSAAGRRLASIILVRMEVNHAYRGERA